MTESESVAVINVKSDNNNEELPDAPEPIENEEVLEENKETPVADVAAAIKDVSMAFYEFLFNLLADSDWP